MNTPDDGYLFDFSDLPEAQPFDRVTSFTHTMPMLWTIEQLENLAEAYEEGEIELSTAYSVSLDLAAWEKIPEALAARLRPFVCVKALD